MGLPHSIGSRVRFKFLGCTGVAITFGVQSAVSIVGSFIGQATTDVVRVMSSSPKWVTTAHICGDVIVVVSEDLRRSKQECSGGHCGKGKLTSGWYWTQGTS